MNDGLALCICLAVLICLCICFTQCLVRKVCIVALLTVDKFRRRLGFTVRTLRPLLNQLVAYLNAGFAWRGLDFIVEWHGWKGTEAVLVISSVGPVLLGKVVHENEGTLWQMEEEKWDVEGSCRAPLLGPSASQ